VIFITQLMADSESTEMSNVELDHQTTDDIQQLLDEDGQVGTEDNLENSFIPDHWNIQSRVNQRRAKWSELVASSVCCFYLFGRWFLEPEVKENYRVVITAWVIVLLGLGMHCNLVTFLIIIINRLSYYWNSTGDY